MALVKKETLSGVEVEVDCSPHGTFDVRAADGRESLGSGDTMEKAIQQARAKLRQKKVSVSIPFFSQAGEIGEAYGVHATTTAVLARLDGKACQLSDYRARQGFRSDMPREKLDRYLELDAEVRTRRREMAAIEREYIFDVAQATRRAIAQKAEEEA